MLTFRVSKISCVVVIARLEAAFGNAKLRLDIASALSFNCRFVYKQLVNTAVTKSYRKAPTDAVAKIISAEKQIAKNLNLDNRIDALAAKSAFITLKDHKPNFANNPTCRLINPSKSEIGIVSKKILQRVNAKIVSTTLTLIRFSRGSIKYQTSHHIHL